MIAPVFTITGGSTVTVEGILPEDATMLHGEGQSDAIFYDGHYSTRYLRAILRYSLCFYDRMVTIKARPGGVISGVSSNQGPLPDGETIKIDTSVSALLDNAIDQRKKNIRITESVKVFQDGRPAEPSITITIVTTGGETIIYSFKTEDITSVSVCSSVCGQLLQPDDDYDWMVRYFHRADRKQWNVTMKANAYTNRFNELIPVAQRDKLSSALNAAFPERHNQKLLGNVHILRHRYDLVNALTPALLRHWSDMAFSVKERLDKGIMMVTSDRGITGARPLAEYIQQLQAMLTTENK